MHSVNYEDTTTTAEDPPMARYLRLLCAVACGSLVGCSAMRTEVSVTYQSGDCSVSAKAWR